MTTLASFSRRLSGLQSALVRIIWAVLALGLLGLFVASLPRAYLRLSALTYPPMQYGTVTWTSESQQAAMRLLHLSSRGYAIYQLGLTTLITLIYWGIAAVITWRRPRDWFAWYVSILLLLLGISSTPIRLAALLPGTDWLMEAKNNVSWPLLFVFAYLFPNGRCVPGWMRWPVAVMAAGFLLSAGTLAVPSFFTIALSLAAAGFGVSAVVAQIYRYWRISSLIERQQTKWVVFALVLFWLLSLVVLNRLGTNHPLYFEAVAVVGLITPATLGISILRYRLFDIDILIRRTLAYGVLTALLALAYFGIVLLLEGVFSALTGQSQSALVTVLSTLTSAVLFVPLRRRVQAFIDRRFYRRKYDAARTLAAFGTRLRDETNLEALSAHLTDVVDETMQPASVGLWLRAPERRQP